ncbi:hypothetical protein DXZ20_32635 [Leptolyngbyaceae cyanobacterium CCMR0081]|uniref:Tetratricopeptide repeat protein n=2 Tax=Adonisia TaxID=2950183 RepID=A0A6M0RWP7_9CYAN|nr:hypothetical protein [Adonisia turfae CCMR0081]
MGSIYLQFSHYQQLKYGVGSVEETVQWDERSAAQSLLILKLLPKFGYQNLFADWTFLNFLQYFGNSELRKTKGYGLSRNYFENVVDNDPYFISSYIFLVNSISIYAGQPEQTIELLEKGLVTMGPNKPNRSYFLWRHKGTDELLFIGNNKAAAESYRTAATWAEQSSDQDSHIVARLSRQTVDFLSTDPNSKAAQISAWSEVLLRATDDVIRQKATINIEALGGTILRAKNGQVTVRYNPNES